MLQYPFYTGRPGPREKPVPELPRARLELETAPDGYIADPGLVDAVNVALLLGQPLLLTGEPGTGKTQLAFNVAYKLGLERPLKFETKSTTVAVDLFYHYDALARFHAAQSGDRSPPDAMAYITFRALGRAILLTNDPVKVAALIKDADRHTAARRSVVLIDEIDKAPRDLPTDILNELEELYFRIPELLGRTVVADPALQPIVIFTSNSEKNLPDAFLRRCVYYNIPFPDRARLQEIVRSRLGAEVDTFLADALDLFDAMRNPATGLRTKPATASLLGWLRAVRQVNPAAENPLRTDPTGRIPGTLAALAKNPDDQDRAREVYESWLNKKP